MSIEISYNGERVETSCIITFCSWDRLKKNIEDACGLKDHEEITGLVVNEDGVKIYLKIKPTP